MRPPFSGTPGLPQLTTELGQNRRGRVAMKRLECSFYACVKDRVAQTTDANVGKRGDS